MDEQAESRNGNITKVEAGHGGRESTHTVVGHTERNRIGGRSKNDL